MTFDFDNFLSAIKYLDKQDILNEAYKKHKLLDKPSSAYTTAQRLSLQHSISELLYWLETGARPEGINDMNFAKFKPVCENLIKKNEMKSETLGIFEK